MACSLFFVFVCSMKVKISDETLAYEYGLEELPALVYYRKKIPIVYTGDLEDEKRVLDWLIEFRDTVDDPDEYVEDSDEIEDVSAAVLQQLIENTDALAVLFCKLKISTKFLFLPLLPHPSYFHPILFSCLT